MLAVQRAEVAIMRLGRRASNLAGGLGHGLQKHGSVANIMKGPLQRGLGSNLMHLTGLHPLGQAVSRYNVRSQRACSQLASVDISEEGIAHQFLSIHKHPHAEAHLQQGLLSMR